MDVTVYDIAKEAGVSVHMAMRALNGTTKMVRHDARERANQILEIAKSMNYRPNDAARSLATKRTGNIGFILSQDVEGGIGNKYYANLFTGIETVCRQNGYGLHFGIGNMLEIDNFVYPKAVAGRSVDGIFLAGSIITPEIIEQFEKIDIPCLCFSHCEIESQKVIRVHRDPSWYKYMFQLCSDYGHKKIGIVELKSRGAYARHERFMDWLVEHEMEYISLPITANSSNEASDEVILQYLALAHAERPTVICSFPDVCMAMINKLSSQKGINCPEDLSFICGGTDNYNPYFKPRLTGIDFDTEKFGKLGAKAMIDHLKCGKKLHKLDITPQISIIAGDSLKKLD